MATTRRSRTPAPDTGGEVAQETPVVDTNTGDETPAETPVVTPDGVQDVTGDNVTGNSPAPDTGNGDAPDDGGDELDEDDGSLKYPAEHFFKSNWYSHKRGELENLLEEDKEYSYAQVERMLSRQ